MPSSLFLDHVVIHVRNLDEAVKDYSQLGFTVVPGGEHPGLGSHNALIAFSDDTYLELIAFPGQPPVTDQGVPKQIRAAQLAAEGRSPVECRFLSWARAPEGIVDYALVPADLAHTLEQAKANTLVMSGPFPGGRLRPDGKQVSWHLSMPDGFDLPFLCADVTSRELRVPGGAARIHANGATGIGRLSVVVAVFELSCQRFHALANFEPKRDDGRFELSSPCAGTGRSLRPTIALRAPRHASSNLSARLGSHGEGAWYLRLRSRSETDECLLDPERCHGALIAFNHK